MRTHAFVYFIEEVAYAHAQNAPLKWFLSIPWLGVVPRLLSEIFWLRSSCIDIGDTGYHKLTPESTKYFYKKIIIYPENKCGICHNAKY